jgi:acyl-coenzyme A synthetase/AMP-(fatty) acid ligase
MAGTARPILGVDPAVAVEASAPTRPFPPDTPLWVMYTSGSTGEPKGVVQTHRNLLHYVRNYANGLRLAPEDRLLTLMRLTVNGGCHDALMTLLTGGTLLLWDVRRDGLHALPAWIAQQHATILSTAPTVFRRIMAELTPDQRLPTLRMLKLWAEPSYRRDFDAFCRRFRDDAVLVNRLGSNEQGSTLWCFLRKDTAFEGNDVPVGYPTEDNAVRLVGDDGRDVPDGEIGEIVACSRYLSPGYWKRDDLTRAAFSTGPGDATVRHYRTGDLGYRRPDGCIVCVGRKDGQVKIRGYRVETAEIEGVLLTHPDVAEVVVIGRADPRAQGEQRLVAYVVAKHGAAGLVPSLGRRALALPIVSGPRGAAPSAGTTARLRDASCRTGSGARPPSPIAARRPRSSARWERPEVLRLDDADRRSAPDLGATRCRRPDRP